MEKWGSFRLTEAEQKEISIDITTNAVVRRHGQQSLIGLVISERFINREAFKATMVKVWKSNGGVVFNEVGDNMFLIEFQNDEDLQKVQKGIPWFFDQNLLWLNTFDGKSAPKDVEFNKEFFWIQLHNIPLGCMTRDVGVHIGSMVGEVVEVDIDEEGIGWGPSSKGKSSYHYSPSSYERHSSFTSLSYHYMS